MELSITRMKLTAKYTTIRYKHNESSLKNTVFINVSVCHSLREHIQKAIIGIFLYITNEPLK